MVNYFLRNTRYTKIYKNVPFCISINVLSAYDIKGCVFIECIVSKYQKGMHLELSTEMF